MFFKNVVSYRLPQGWSVTAEALAEQLAISAFQECGSSSPVSSGWVAPQKGGSLVHAVNGQFLIALQREVRDLPSKVIKRAADEQAKAIEEAEGRKVGRKEMRDIREQKAVELLPRAFTSISTTYAWIDPVNGWISIDASTPAKAEDVLEMLRKTVDPVPSIALLQLKVSPHTAMTNWLSSNEAPAHFTIDQDLELASAENSKVRYVKHQLEGEDIRQHIADGKIATKLALTWADKISFVLTDKMQLKKIAFLDILKEQADGQAENADERFDIDFTLMSGELARLYEDLVAALGGEGAAE